MDVVGLEPTTFRIRIMQRSKPRKDAKRARYHCAKRPDTVFWILVLQN